ncbi:LOW QUALITY PROTEIN: hypothetical protein CRUP_031173 [Coryphaenoides rupestris]|nr:LOW QUALITY PROTEIN: hypothetical protein CRUP_031173 [Coryphaenoides rupestris]
MGNLLLSSTVLKPAYCLIVQGLKVYMGPLVYGKTPGSSSTDSFESALVYTGLTSRPSGVRQTRSSGSLPFSCFLANWAHFWCSSAFSRCGEAVWKWQVSWVKGAEEDAAWAPRRRRAASAAAHAFCAAKMSAMACMEGSGGKM